MTKRRNRKYRLRNWSDYNAALVRRGSLTLWVDSRSVDSWLSRDSPARRGRRRLYPDTAITCCLMLREVYHLPLRATEGLARSLLSLLDAGLPAPDYSTLSRRARLLRLSLAPGRAEKIRHLVVDSTDLKLYGEGGWKARLYDLEKRRAWRKLHPGVDASTHRVAAAVVTEKEVIDPRVLPRLLGQVKGPVGRVYADGAYDARGCYKAIHQKGARSHPAAERRHAVGGRVPEGPQRHPAAGTRAWGGGVEEAGEVSSPLAGRDGGLPLQGTLLG